MDWISVRDRLPKPREEVLLHYLGAEDIGSCGWKGFGIGMHNPKARRWISNQGMAMPEIAEPTHWQPLPAPPKESSIG